PGEGVRDLLRTRDGDLWVGTNKGAVVLSRSAHSPAPPEAAGVEGERFKVPVGAEDLGRAAIAGFAERGRGGGEVLIATENERLYAYKDGHLREVVHDELLRGVDALYTDAEGLVWIGTVGGGLRLLDGEKLTAFTVREGLFDDDVFGIVEDGSGADDRLWMACSKGIFFVPRADLRAMAGGKLQHLESTPFSPTEGLRTIECRSGVHPAAWRMGDGRLWFSTIHGVIVIDPKHLQRATGPAPAVIEDVIVNGHSEPPPWADQIGTLAAGVKNLEFHYTGLSFIAPVRIGFRYQLEGFDKDWVDAGPRREAFYTNLSPGNYTFRVQAKNIEGSWSKTATAEFTLAPYFYQRAWFWPACVALAAAAGFVAYRLRIRAIKGRLNAIVAERSRIARELHDTLLQGFSGVTMEMQALSARLPESQERGTLVEIIRDAANCMKEARRSVAGLRPPQRGATEGETVGLAAAVGEAARHLTETRDVKLVLDVEERLPALGAEVEYNLVRICQEAVANSVKHSGARVIEVTLRRAEGGVRLVVRDDGRGFEYAGAVNGAGGHYGIVGMRERAAAIHGTLEVESELGRGTSVKVVVRGSDE
ncbi:MAG TPA: triple tyrosine motif-containing protein, partial [Phycisphaerae bacterium]|nr:triple tyrosine motif-containing protein [Phycisphaerae bacterium]